MVALTFDDGPSVSMRQVSDAVSRAGGKATFFLNGQNWGNIYDPAKKASIKYALQQGHQIASHTWSHPHLPKLTRDQIYKEFSTIDDAIMKIAGVRPAFVRPPYGEYNDDVISVANERGQTLVNWDFDSGDSMGKTAAQSNQLYDQRVQQHPPSILTLNHDVFKSTVETVLPHALSVLTGAGYNLVTVADCLGRDPYQDSQDSQDDQDDQDSGEFRRSTSSKWSKWSKWLVGRSG